MSDTSGQAIGLALDCADPERLAEFWAPALGYVSLGEAGAYVVLLPDRKPGPSSCCSVCSSPGRSRTGCTSTSRPPMSRCIRFLREREKDWAKDNLFTVHNWWHLALYLLEAERPSDSLAIYDTQVHGEASAGVPLEMLDASALLWRLLLDGVDTGGRFSTLADAWATRTSDEPWYAFNDLHAVLALSGAGRIDDARMVIDRLDSYVISDRSRGEASNFAVTAEIGMPVSRAAVAFVQGRQPMWLPSSHRSTPASSASAAPTRNATSCSARCWRRQSCRARSISPVPSFGSGSPPASRVSARCGARPRCSAAPVTRMRPLELTPPPPPTATGLRPPCDVHRAPRYPGTPQDCRSHDLTPGPTRRASIRRACGR